MSLRVLVIDDSAYSRTTLSGLLKTMPGIKAVATAIDGVDGFKQAREFDPDLIMLDLEMPNMDGFTFLRLIKTGRQVPVIVVTGKGKCASEAMGLGAIDYIEKPTMEPSKKLFSIKGELERKIRRIPAARRQERTSGSKRNLRDAQFITASAVVIGASTGGPKTISSIIKALPEDFPVPVFISLHMPKWLTLPFTERLNHESALKVRVAKDGEPVESGAAFLAPGGFHLSFFRGAGVVCTRLERKSSADLHSPSIDRMFSSAANIWCAGLTGIILTGMGSDGMAGMIEIKNSGGFMVAESDKTAVVNSMPEAALSTGRVDMVLPSDEIACWLTERYSRLRKLA
ncbi:MAG: chemotaxis-specific protein-glutamate methyltransferase CheB [Deltaproteobacteria bacterium]|nr:chemotaxis-specific protein-glutamate methyltransferase CheB [Deltaproteobacteria bacterium]